MCKVVIEILQNHYTLSLFALTQTQHLPLNILSKPLFSILSMVKIWVEICLISARGVRASHSLWKRQWYAIGWVDPTNKYITKVDASTNTNPLWRTKFSIQVDNSDPNFHDLALNVEVYSRDPFFFTEKLHGSATVLLKEFLAKGLLNDEGLRQGSEEVGSYQLRKKKSGKPSGFVDVSVRVSEDKEEPNSHSVKFNGVEFLMKMKGKNVMFVGDSLGRNQWQSLIYMISAAAPRVETELVRGDPLSTFTFLDYGVNISFHRTPYLVDVDVVQGKKKFKA
ncbi:putative C2 domain, PC-Esterase [Medicago truncatula]|uniref:Putative C2 domain, PC-Esterase n=1 Tax=Medicago truncatula TaxID=3880 RepID=A0A396HSU2_MEDTR|nr:putative C2 domain, PC-Esterase [Medicago truncatula]